ncbi:MAG: oligoendopeptidase F [candidate division Zixibacteria bacterium]|nr:oligoendopeptidase F [candidate division Zixibacteria bacterium]
MLRSRSRYGVLLALLGPVFAAVLSASAADIPQRSGIDAKYKWRLGDMYSSDADWQKTYDFLAANYERLGQYKGHLNQPADLLACLQLSDSLGLISDNLYVYANLKLDEDNRESKYQEMSDKIGALNSKVSAATSYVEPEILTLTSEQIEGMLSATPALGLYRHYLENLNRTRAHILSDTEENLLASAAPVLGAPSKIFGMIDEADITFGTVKDATGQEVALTKGKYQELVESPNREVRRAANQQYNKTYLKHINGLGASLSSSVKKDYFLAKTRKYPTCLDHSLYANNVPTSVFHNLISAVRANLAPLHKWASIRKRILGVDTLYTYDLWANLLPGTSKTYTYDEAKQVVLKGLAPMGKEYLANFEKGLNSGWIDVYETQGKGSGAYNWGTYSSHPYILLNYNGTVDHVFTLAHEMGHAMHAFYTNRTEPYVYSGHPLFTAEVASTCNEAVLMKYLLATTKDKKEQLDLLIRYIEQIMGTFYTQVMFSEFELAIHDRVEKGEALSVDFFRKTYRQIYQDYWGPELVIDSINDLGGMRISHFYRQYYVYQYATCYAAAQTISQKIMEDGKKYLPVYQQFLKTGYSKYAVDILKDAGVDMTTPEPVNRTIKTFGDLVDQVEKLLNEKN